MGDLDARWSALVESGRARWSMGMWTQEVRQRDRVLPLWDESVVVSEADKFCPAYVYAHCGRGLREIHPGAVPDWSDGATKGALLNQVRERWGDPYLIAVWSPERKLWGVGSPLTIGQPGRVSCTGETEAEALIAALEAAPEGA